MSTPISYVYERGHWMRDTGSDERVTPGEVIKNLLGVLFLCAVMVLGMMALLCG